MDNLEPITRNEMFLDGGDLTPITRKEMFIKRIYDKNQSVPEPITREEYFLNKAGEGSGGDVTIEQLNVTENGTYSESGKAYSPVIVDVPTPPVPENAYLLNNLSGLPADIASFNDGTDLPMASLKVAVTPYQDLHGYDAPWAGGAGKNKLPSISQTQTINGVTWTLQSDGSIKLSGTATANSVYDFGRSDNLMLKSGSYFANENGTNYTVTIFSVVGGLVDTIKNGGGAFSISEDTEIFERVTILNGTSIDETLYPMIESGTTATAYAPYSNICPIIGWDEAVVNVTGINIWDEEWEVGGIGSINGENTADTETIRSKNFISVLPNTQYYIGCQRQLTGWVRQRFYDAEKNYIGYTGQVTNNGVFTTANNCYYMRFTTYASGGYGTTYNNDISINYPSTDTSYHAYNGATYTIDLDGTRYGGTLDATNGTMDDTLDHIASYNGEALPSTWISDRDVYAEGTTPTIGAEVVYTRATPITVQLAPQPVKSIEGENNISANCGQITEVKYFKRA